MDAIFLYGVLKLTKIIILSAHFSSKSLNQALQFFSPDDK